jgi:ribonuclease P protein component
MGGNGNEAYVSTIQNATRSKTWISRAGPHAWRTQGSSQSARQRSASSWVVAASAKRFGLGAGRRLRQKADFERLLRQGARRSFDGFTFYLERREAGGARLGMLVSRKHAARSTDRNRIKRCIREAFRMEHEGLGPLDLLVRPPYGVRPSARMISRLREMLGKLTQ